MTLILGAIGRRASLVLLLGVFIGFFIPGLGETIGAALPFLVVLLLTVAMIRVDFAHVLSHIRRPSRIVLPVFLLMVLLPALVHGLAAALALPPSLHLVLVLLSLAPPLSASPGMAAMLGLDDALVLTVMAVCTLTVPLFAPFLAVDVFSLPVDLEMTALLLRLVGTVGIALVLALLARRLIGRRRIEANADVLDGISAIIMVVFAIVVVGGIEWLDFQDPARALPVLAAVFLANWGVHMAAVLVLLAGPGLSRRGGGVALMAGNRNLAIFLAVLPAEIAESLFLFLALYQLPIYLTPALASPLYSRLLGRRKIL